jgi:hypothetical protein
VRSALAIASAALALTALGCSAEEPSERAATAVLPAANTACLQARVEAVSEPPGARLADRARHALPVATRTLAALQALETQPAARLQREYERLFELYRRAATPQRRRDRTRLADALASAEASVRSEAQAARLPACSPP